MKENELKMNACFYAKDTVLLKRALYLHFCIYKKEDTC